MKLYFFLLFLILLFGIRFITYTKTQNIFHDGQSLTFTARLLQEPEQRGRVRSFSLRPPGYEPLYISVPLYPEYHYADVLTVSGTVRLAEGEKKTFPTMRYPEVVIEDDASLFYSMITFVRQKIERVYTQTLPPIGASLLMGIVFGLKQGMPPEFKDALQLTGVYHVVAASGMNVSLVAGAFLAIFGSVLRRQYALFLSILGVFSYAFLAGFEPSIVRASIMGSIVFFSGMTGRQHTSVWTLFVTGYLMLFWDPGLVTDVGFQLSFLATLGILLIVPVIPDAPWVMNRSQKVGKSSDGNLVVTDLKTTIAAQLGTLPILLGAFGAVSILSVPVNMFVLWTIPPLMVIGSISALTGFLFEPLGKLIAVLALPFLLYFEWVVMVFSRFDLMFRVESVPWFFVVTYYLILYIFVWQIQSKHQNRESRIRNHGKQKKVILERNATVRRT